MEPPPTLEAVLFVKYVTFKTPQNGPRNCFRFPTALYMNFVFKAGQR